MRSRPNSTPTCLTRSTRHIINYTEQGMKDSGHDSDFEPVLKPQRPLDNKSHPTPTRIAMQKEIELNKATKRSSWTAFPEEMDVAKKNNKATGIVNKPFMPTQRTPPPHMPVPDATNTPLSNELPDATQNLLPDKMAENKRFTRHNRQKMQQMIPNLLKVFSGQNGSALGGQRTCAHSNAVLATLAPPH